MVALTLPAPAFKKDGTLHLRNCAAFYGVQPQTLRTWYRGGAPIYEPLKMSDWKQERNRRRLEKIGAKNNRYGSKRMEIERLYVQERLGLRAISRYFSGRPSIGGVRSILVGAGVYRYGERLTDQAARSAARRKIVIEAEKEQRRRIATCLWRLRTGHPVESTCRQNGWNPKSIWNALGPRASYRRFKARRLPRWPDKRRFGPYYSRAFPKETLLHDRVEHLLGIGQIKYVKECRLRECRTRVDFKTDDGTFIECKVGANSGQMYEFIGQACHYRLFATRVILCLPSDVQIRADLYELIICQGVIVCNENTLLSVLSGKELPAFHSQLIPAKKTSFVCKCCGSAERRRHRMNSYCVDCGPAISEMRFDYHVNRWVIAEKQPFDAQQLSQQSPK
ncbi:MAG TPA: hypothetical protein VK581_05785 [Chthoniobacterales bacterium]|nr:hypothetical protein [Chthoniobacterales bacterium]